VTGLNVSTLVAPIDVPETQVVQVLPQGNRMKSLMAKLWLCPA
jgi:hypothetical protein